MSKIPKQRGPGEEGGWLGQFLNRGDSVSRGGAPSKGGAGTGKTPNDGGDDGGGHGPCLIWALAGFGTLITGLGYLANWWLA